MKKTKLEKFLEKHGQAKVRINNTMVKAFKDPKSLLNNFLLQLKKELPKNVKTHFEINGISIGYMVGDEDYVKGLKDGFKIAREEVESILNQWLE